jgi:hypothetical protein
MKKKSIIMTVLGCFAIALFGCAYPLRPGPEFFEANPQKILLQIYQAGDIEPRFMAKVEVTVEKGLTEKGYPVECLQNKQGKTPLTWSGLYEKCKPEIEKGRQQDYDSVLFLIASANSLTYNLFDVHLEKGLLGGTILDWAYKDHKKTRETDLRVLGLGKYRQTYVTHPEYKSIDQSVWRLLEHLPVAGSQS